MRWRAQSGALEQILPGTEAGGVVMDRIIREDFSGKHMFIYRSEG